MNVAEAVAEKLLPYKELLTPVLPGQDNKATATSCFHVYSNWSFLLLNSSAKGTTNLTVKLMNSTAKAPNCTTGKSQLQR